MIVNEENVYFLAKSNDILVCLNSHKSLMKSGWFRLKDGLFV